MPKVKKSASAAPLQALCEQLRGQFPEKLMDLRLSHGDARAGLYQPSGTVASAPLSQAPDYDVGCIQTLLEGLALALLCQERVLDPDAMIGQYLPELNWDDVRAPGRRIRVRDLASHATGYHAPSGVAGEAGFDDWEAIVAYFRATPETFPPGQVCSWNGLGRSLLGPLVQRVTGRRLHEIVRARVRELGGFDPVISGEDSGWPAVLVSLDDLERFLLAAMGPGGPISDLPTRLPAESVSVVRRPLSARSGNPIAYGFGVAQFADGLWGQSGNGRTYTMGLRFDLTMTLLTTLALGAPPFARDLVLQYLAGACGFMRQPAPSDVLGAIVSCSLDDLPGVYVGDYGDAVDVTTGGQDLRCAVSRRGEVLATIPMSATQDGVLIGNGRWNAFQFEFFPHPETGRPCLMLGQIAYVQVDPR
ncbi:serine hydrolase domain-containing protein [Caulobacter rhizosphaerae]|uniref:serine hydrolase domain-containing protein n=1 Tax=Caulobacter rhizosphaerae TaxID=2010972 RepID=UPI0013D24248|nr:serine hydrolase domain-containing protein [Caulobacter rhizosphaerae]GGL41517.1 hypothetical protein GCM10010983_43470 [Caulobacter rhizosphaerae]